MATTTRQRRPDDEGLFRRLFATARSDLQAIPLPTDALEALIDQQWRAQQSQHRAAFPTARDTVIEVDGTSVGRMLVAYLPDEVRLVDVALLPSYRNRGVGTQLIREVCEQATAKAQPVRLHVLAHGPARRLYLRLGFRPTSPSAAAEAYDELEWVPHGGQDAPTRHG
jgi:ribosomal protein S18 acetylase RimI-like enzyme